jgi:Fic family protein
MTNDEPQPSGLWVPINRGEEFPDALQHKGAFVPRPLPAEVPLSSKTYQALAAAEQALGRLDEAAQRLPDRSILVRTTQLREVQHSAGLEDMSAALHEMLLLDLPGLQEKPAVDQFLVSYVRAADKAFTRVWAGTAVNLELLAEISADLAPDPVPNLDAVWRNDLAWLGGREPRDADLICAPPGPYLRAAAEQWSAWVEARSDLPLLCKVALGHYQIEVLQAFAFGTRHLSRLYIGLELVRAGALRDQILPISVWLDRHHVEWHRTLQRVVHAGAFDDFVRLFAEGIREQSLIQIKLINRLEQLRAEQLAKIPGRGSGTSKTRTVLSELISFPITNHKHIENRHHLSFKMATEVMRNLHGQGLVEILDNKKYRKVFLCAEAMELLSLDDPTPPDHDGDAFS